MSKASNDPPPTDGTETETKPKRKLSFGRRSSKDKTKTQGPRQKWGKAITGVRAASRVGSQIA